MVQSHRAYGEMHWEDLFESLSHMTLMIFVQRLDANCDFRCLDAKWGGGKYPPETFAHRSIHRMVRPIFTRFETIGIGNHPELDASKPGVPTLITCPRGSKKIQIMNLSLASSVVPRQWKSASILPIPKISTPLEPADYRPISITPVLSRVLERIVVTD